MTAPISVVWPDCVRCHSPVDRVKMARDRHSGILDIEAVCHGRTATMRITPEELGEATVVRFPPLFGGR
jgi:hypothetical protein